MQTQKAQKKKFIFGAVPHVKMGHFRPEIMLFCNTRWQRLPADAVPED
jgi:hypothetical protein